MKLENIHLSAPISVELLITRRCNYKCRHCIFSCAPSKNEELNKEDIKKIIKLLARLKVFTIGINGGEPLLRKNELYEIIKLIKKKRMQFIITTNGSLLDKKFVSFIAKKKIACIRISLLFPTKKEYEKFVGKKNVFEKVITNIKYCVEKKISTVLLFPLYKRNFKYFDHILKFAKETGVTAVNIFPIIPYGRGKDICKELLSQKEYKNFLKFIAKKRKQLKDIILMGDFPLEFLVNKKLLNEAKNTLGMVCPAGALSCVINWKGDVYPCPFFPISQGNIFEQSFERIWKESKLFKELRSIKRFRNSECGKCKYLYICRGGCPARTFATYNTINKKDPICWYK